MIVLACGAFMFTAVVACSSRSPEVDNFRNVLYVGDWTHYSQGLEPQNLPYEDLTHLVYSFGNITESKGTA